MHTNTETYFTGRGLCKVAGVSFPVLRNRADKGLIKPAAMLSTGGALYTIDQAKALVSNPNQK